MHLRDKAILVPAHAAFGEDVGAGAFPCAESAGGYFLGVTEAVDGGRVDPVDAEFEGAVNSGDRIIVVLRAPTELPAAAAESPGAEAHRRDVDI